MEFPSLSIRCVALLGRKDKPTDAVEEYCTYLSSALETHDIQLAIQRVTWEIDGWPEALQSLRLRASNWRDHWVLVQYTALAWSARGFPQRVLSTVKILKSAGARVAIVFHDVEPYPGTRLIDTIRRFGQVWTMRRVATFADLNVFTVPPERISWLANVPGNAVFIPVGANLPIPTGPKLRSLPNRIPTIGVFSITGGEAGVRETKVIVTASRFAAERLGALRLSVFGRQAEVRETELREGLRDVPVELSVEGLIEPENVVQRLAGCDVLLFVRGPISSRRGSAIAGIACGLPVIAYPGSETAMPITGAGLVLVSPSRPDDLNAALVRVLSDTTYRMELSARSRATYENHFAWPAIAARFNSLLTNR